MIVTKLATERARKELAVLNGETKTRQSKRAQELAAYEKKVKELVRLLDITTRGLDRAAQLVQVMSPDVAANLKAVVKTVHEQRDAALNPAD